ncbi:MAG: DNA polymerase III subunit gamma/tau [Gammaproteobacteria bacterium]|nr:DNA polymerase III subunit gamma/tau [Gammaproteobacteria bacterium]
MSYLALARKWRPRRFDEMVGQEHVLRALVNALDNERLHHAYLFAGTRGVGKTTIARIFAKCLNCERGVSATPCGECAACREIDEGRFVDLLEVDAASRTKVEDTRDLLDNVQYRPARGRYKVYLIDEVHMLSKHSFNALLKTLEEPPPHVKFLLATTDPQKLPVTVLSRCLQFSLKRLPLDLIEGRLREICAAESIAAEPAALAQLARAADGSLRDALSLLDQAVAYGGGQVTGDEVAAMLGSLDQAQLERFVDALCDDDGERLLQEVARIAEQVPDYAEVLDALATLLQRIALVQVVPDMESDERFDAETLRRLAGRLAPEETQLFYQIAILGRRDLGHAPDPRSGFEMTLLRMLAFRPAGATDATATVVRSRNRTERAEPAPATGDPRAAGGPGGSASGPQSDWTGLLARLELRGAVRQLAANSLCVRHEDDEWELLLDPEDAHLLTEQLRRRFLHALEAESGRPMRLKYRIGKMDGETMARRSARQADERLQAARASIDEDPNVRALKETFGARVQPESVKPVN